MLFLLLTCALFDLAPTARAVNAPPDRMTYQGYLVDASGAPLGGSDAGPQNYDVVFRIYNDQSASDPKKNLLWSEQQTVTVDKGNFSVLLGEGNPLAGEPNGPISSLFDSAQSSSDADQRFIEVTVKGVGNAKDATITPRLRLVPGAYSFLSRYSLNAKNADLARNATLADSAKVAAAMGNVDSSVAVSVTTNNGLSFLSIKSPTLFTAPSGQSAEIDLVGSTSTLRLAANPGSGGNSIQSLGNASGTDAPFAFTDHAGAPLLAITAAGNVGIGTNTPGTKLVVNGNATVTGTFTASSFAGPGIVPIGAILMWSGSTANIPQGWALCDGSLQLGTQTPDLRGRFVVGAGPAGSAGPAYGVGETGGLREVSLSVAQMPTHSHSYKDGYFAENVNSGKGWDWRLTPPGGGLDPIDPQPIPGQSGTTGINGSGSTDRDNDTIYWRPMTTNPTGSGQPQENRPPYFALAYIIRVQ